MNRSRYVLACLSVGNATVFSPVQLQKLFFLLDRNISGQVGGPYFSFEPYLYGPFDKEVYSELETLVDEGLAEKIVKGTWKEFALTPKGKAMGKIISETLPVSAQAYIGRAIQLVTKLSFRELVSTVYDAYPEMRKNSIFLR